MKTGRSLVDLATELERQKETRRDFVSPAPLLRMETRDERVVLRGLPIGDLGVTPHAHGQFADHVEIPQRYYNRMLSEAPGLLAQNVNEWLGRDHRTRRTVRTLDGNARAFLSSAYRPLDNLDLAETVLPVLAEKKCEIRSCELTDLRLYVKATLPGLTAEVAGSRQKGDVVEAGIVISNSEVGAGAVRIEPFLFRLACLNGAIWPDSSVRKFHVGRKTGDDAVRELLTDETKRLSDAAFWHSVRDVARAAFDREVFERIVARVSAATQERVESTDLEAVVETTDRRLGLALSNAARGSILRNLIEGGDLSRWGLANAVTATANGVEDYELATRLERAGGSVIELAREDWHAISTASTN